MKTRTPLFSWLLVMAFVITGLSLVLVRAGYAASPTSTPTVTSTAAQGASPSATPAAGQPTPEVKSEGAKQVQPGVESNIEEKAAEKRAQLLKDAQAALDDTHKALEALERGKKDEAIAALERVTGKLDLIVAREPSLSLAPVVVTTIVRDLYSQSETVKEAVRLAKGDLNAGRVQQARRLLSGLASEADVQVTSIPLATYPAAIKAVAPLIDAGKIDEAKAALELGLRTLVVQDFITPLPKPGAQAILEEAEKLAEKSGRNEEENRKLHDLLEDARRELQIGELLGYGMSGDYKSVYVQLDEIEKKTGGGKSGKGFFDRIKGSLKNLKDQLSS
jgi:hypothetical protein